MLIFTGKWLYDQGLRDPVSRKTHVSAVREFYGWLKRHGQIKSNQAEHVPQPKTGRRLPRVMSLGHAEQLMWAPDYASFEGVRDAAILGLLMGCGLRVSGLVGLNESNIVHAVIDGQNRIVVRVIEKGEKERQLPVPQQADLLLRLYMEHPQLAGIDRTLENGDRVLFISTRNRTIPPHDYRGEARRLSRKGVLRMIQTHAKRIGIPLDVAHPHALRHMYGTELAEHDVPTVTAANMLGHTDPKNTAIYQHLAMRKLTRVADQANPLASIRTPVSELLASISKG